MLNKSLVTKYGKKAAGLIQMRDAGINVPLFICLDQKTAEAMQKPSFKVNRETKSFLSHLCDKNSTFSVRSSGSHSAPGRMKTKLNVRPQELNELFSAMELVTRSASSASLTKYLEAKKIKSFKYGVILQEMINVKRCQNSCSGVLTTIDPITEDKKLYGNVLWRQWGESLMSGQSMSDTLDSLRKENFNGYLNLEMQVNRVSNLFGNIPLEIEFAIDGSTAWILQARPFKQILRTNQQNLEIHTTFENILGSGTSATPLSCIGIVTYDKKNCKDKILITEDTNFEDTQAILDAKGIITLKGGSLCHAAIVAREFDKPCITGMNFKIKTPKEGDKILLHYRGGAFIIKEN